MKSDMQTIKKCKTCNRYTLKKKCDVCRLSTVEIRPPKYSPEDKYGKYRRIQKLSER